MTSRLLEGVEFDKDNESFSFDFKTDNASSVVKLVTDGPYQVEDYIPCTYFGYVFEDNIDARIKKKFIDLIKYPSGQIEDQDLKKFICLAVAALDKRISLPKYDVIVHPQSSSQLNNLIVSEIYKKSLSTKYLEIELVKDLPANMEFNYGAWIHELKSKPGVNQNNIDASVEAVDKMMVDIKKLGYVKIGSNVKAKWRPYLKNFFKFKDESSRKAFFDLESGRNVLIVDDVSTTRATLQYVLNTVRNVNDTCNIAMFCLLGNKVKMT